MTRSISLAPNSVVAMGFSTSQNRPHNGGRSTPSMGT